MKLIDQSIELIAWFDTEGIPHPVRFRYNGSVIRIQQITQMMEEGYDRSRRKVFRCQSEVLGRVRVFELKFEYSSCKWVLWKM